MRSSKAAFDLIVSEEVTSEAVYSKKYRKPEWPGAQSGATVGIGYDLGQTSKATITSDWKGRVSGEMLEAMLSASGITGEAAKPVAQRLRAKIDIPWDVARAVHEARVIPRWEAKVAAALPNTDNLSPDCFGAVLSLTFNRGPSFSTGGPRYAEMRNIKAHMAAEDYAAIPDEFRAMKRLWPDLAGLRSRRDKEASLFTKGLKSISSSGVSGRSPRPDDIIDPVDELTAPETKTADTTVVTARATAATGTGLVVGGQVLDKMIGGAGDAVNKITEVIGPAGDVQEVTKKVVSVPKPGFWYGVVHFVSSPEFVVSMVLLIAGLWVLVWLWQRQHKATP